MGLDIYLYPTAEHRADEERGRAWNELYESGRWEAMTDAEKGAWRDEHPYSSRAEKPSERYPDHLFNRRYLRSSYNSSGFNRAVPEFVGDEHGLYWIFEPMGRHWDGDEGTLGAADVPLLRQCRERAVQVAGELRKCDPLRTMSASMIVGQRAHMWATPPSDSDVLDWYRQEKQRYAGSKHLSDGGYSNAKGTVLGFAEGVEVLALTVGLDILGKPSAIAVYRASRETVDSYVQSAEIVAEFCDEAIELIERDGSAHMSWSG